MFIKRFFNFNIISLNFENKCWTSSRSQFVNMMELKRIDSAGKLLRDSITIKDPLGRDIRKREKEEEDRVCGG